MALIQNFKTHLQQNFPGLAQRYTHWLLAVSGGIDSVVLCDLAYHAGINFTIAHCNFQLRGHESKRDEDFVRTLGDRYGKNVLVQKFDTAAYAEANKLSTQVAARILRYEWFHALVEQLKEEEKISAVIVTAHHANDNIETVLMNFFKGTGISGLHGIQPLQNGILRPLLPFTRDQLLQYYHSQNLSHVEDSSNIGDKYTRNFVRHKLMPLVKEIYPSAEQNLLNNIARFNEVEQLYRQAVNRHKEKLIEYKGKEAYIPVLKLQLSSPLHTIVYEIIEPYNFSAAQVHDVIALLDSESGKYVSSSTHRVLKNRKWLIISPIDNATAANIVIEEGDRQVSFAGGAIQLDTITVDDKFQMPASSSIACLDAKHIHYPLLLRKWKQGDYFYPLGMKKKKKLSRFFIDNKLSMTDKEKVWVLESDKRIVWVVGRRIDERFKMTPSTQKALLLHYNA